MIGALKHKSIQKNLDKLLKQQQRELPNEPLRSVLVLTDSLDDDLKDRVEQLRTSLNIKPADLWIREFTEGIKAEELQRHQWSKKHFGWKGGFQHEDAQMLSAKNFDLVVGFYWDANIYLDSIIAEIPNSFRVGTNAGNAVLYDLMIDTPRGDWGSFENELLKYLSILKLRA